MQVIKNDLVVNETNLSVSGTWDVDLDSATTASFQPVYADATPSAEVFQSTEVEPSTAATGTVTIVLYDQASMAGSTVTIAGHPLVEGVDWNAATDNDTTAASLASAIDALTEVTAVAASAVITVTAATVGTAGNAIAVVKTAANAGMTISGNTLSGGTDVSTITLAATEFVTGLKVALTGGGSLPGGLSATNYWVIKVDDDTIRLATSLANAEAGTFVTITSVGTSATDRTLTPASIAGIVVKLQASNDGTNWSDISGKTVTISAAGNQVWDLGTVTYAYVRVVETPSAGAVNLTVRCCLKQ